MSAKAKERKTSSGILRIAVLLVALAFVPVYYSVKDAVLPSSPSSDALNKYIQSEVPGLQYVVVAPDRVLFEFAGGWSDIRNQRAMTADTTLMAYSMTKTFTAIAILQLVERKQLALDDIVDRYLPDTVYRQHNITIRQLLTHTSGIPNPIPLRWTHLVEEHSSFSEAAALAKVLAESPTLSSEPGDKYAYTNIGYWLLGKVIEQVTGLSYTDYVRQHILQPLQLSSREMDFVIQDESLHANGYLKKFSLMNLVKGFMIDPKFIGSYEGDWLRVNSHYPNGPAFGGLIGTARSFSRFLQDQLRAESVLLSSATRNLLESPQLDGNGRSIPMTLGWHVGKLDGVTYLFKEGGGGGFHCEMRIYPTQGVGTVVMTNSTNFKSTRFLNGMDKSFLSSIH